MTTTPDMTLNITQQTTISADAATVFDSMIRRLTTENSTSDNRAMPMVLEPWPGGRWFRDLGDNQGHLWGLVQVIKPPFLLEIYGPMFMSYAVAGHLQLRVTESSDGAHQLTLRHQVLGLVDDEHRQHIDQGWAHFVSTVKELAEITAEAS